MKKSLSLPFYKLAKRPLFTLFSLVTSTLTTPVFAQNTSHKCPVVVSDTQFTSVKTALMQNSLDLVAVKQVRDMLEPITPETVAWRVEFAIRLFGNKPEIINQIQFEGLPGAFLFKMLYDVALPQGTLNSQASREQFLGNTEKLLSGEITVNLSKEERSALEQVRRSQLLNLKNSLLTGLASPAHVTQSAHESLISSFRMPSGERLYVLKKALGRDYEKVAALLTEGTSAQQFTLELTHALDKLALSSRLVDIVDFLLTPQ